jgi:hypothetical protein
LVCVVVISLHLPAMVAVAVVELEEEAAAE